MEVVPLCKKRGRVNIENSATDSKISNRLYQGDLFIPKLRQCVDQHVPVATVACEDKFCRIGENIGRHDFSHEGFNRGDDGCSAGVLVEMVQGRKPGCSSLLVRREGSIGRDFVPGIDHYPSVGKQTKILFKYRNEMFIRQNTAAVPVF